MPLVFFWSNLYIWMIFFRFMRGEFSTRCNEGPKFGKGDITPGTPANPSLSRQPPSYQRMHSNDSGSGKGSDKDVNGNTGHSRD